MKDKGTNIYLDDTIETFAFEKEALEIKFKHNIDELSNKNTYLTTILKQLTTKENQLIKQDCRILKEMISTCRGIEDQLEGLDILEKKTQILKAQILALAYQMKSSKEEQKSGERKKGGGKGNESKEQMSA